MTGTQLWYDELAQMLSDVGAKVVPLKKFSGDLSYVAVPVGPDFVEITQNREKAFSVDFHTVSTNEVDEIIGDVFRLGTVDGVVRRYLSSLQKV